jgi:hypothetical protein
LVVAATAGAQSHADTLQHGTGERHQVNWSYGVSAGAMHFGGGGHEQALAAIVGAEILPGLSLSVNPTYATAQAAPSIDATTGRLVSSPSVHGLGDLPVGLGYWHSFGGAWEPGLYLSLGATLPTGDTATVGSGETSFGTNASLSLTPVTGWSVDLGAGHSLSNDYAAGLGTIAPTAVSMSVSHAIGKASLSASYSTEAGAMPVGTTHSQTFGAGASVPLFGSFALTADASAGHADGESSWAVAVGVGTTFAGVGQVSPVQRLAQAFGKGSSKGKTRSTAAKLAHGKKSKR